MTKPAIDARLGNFGRRARFLLFRAAFRALPETRTYGLKRWCLRAAGLQVGQRTRVHSRAIFHTADVTIGDDVWIASDVHVHGNAGARVTIGDRCAIGPHVVFMTGSHDVGGREKRAGRGSVAGIVIGDGTAIATGALILPGVTLGHGCAVAARAVVSKSFGDDILLAGAPARPSRRLDAAGDSDPTGPDATA